MAFVKNLFDQNFIQYASYVIRDRAIPEIIDGFSLFKDVSFIL